MIQPHDPVQALDLIVTHLAMSDEAFRLLLCDTHDDLFLFRSLLFHVHLVFLLLRHTVTLARGRRCPSYIRFRSLPSLGLQPERAPMYKKMVRTTTDDGLSLQGLVQASYANAMVASAVP